jgi:ribosomal protein L44E
MRRVSVQAKTVRRLNYVCPKCKSDLITNNEGQIKKNYSSGKLEKDYTDRKDYGSATRTNLRLKCLNCQYEWTILSSI